MKKFDFIFDLRDALKKKGKVKEYFIEDNGKIKRIRKIKKKIK